jgi:ABC-type transporter Mla subunit MlaD
MAVLINELLEEAISRALEVAKQADEAREAAADLLERAHALGGKVEADAEEAHGLFQDAVAKLDEAESRLEQASDRAEGPLDTLRSKVDEVQGKIDALVEAVKSGTSQLEERKTQIAGDLDEKVQAAQDELGEVSTKTDELQEDLDQRAEALSKAISDLGEALSAAGQGLEEARGRFNDSLEQLVNGAQTWVETYVDIVSASLQEATDTVVGCGNQMIAAHNTAVGILRTQFTEEAPKHVQDAMEPVKLALETLETLCGEQEGDLDQRAEAVLQKVREALRLAEAVQPVLAQSTRVS